MATLPTILLLLGASVVSVIVFRSVSLPPVLGYLLVGTLIGPHAFNLVEGFAGAQHLAEFGVVFLMFSASVCCRCWPPWQSSPPFLVPWD